MRKKAPLHCFGVQGSQFHECLINPYPERFWIVSFFDKVCCQLTFYISEEVATMLLGSSNQNLFGWLVERALRHRMATDG